MPVSRGDRLMRSGRVGPLRRWLRGFGSDGRGNVAKSFTLEVNGQRFTQPIPDEDEHEGPESDDHH